MSNNVEMSNPELMLKGLNNKIVKLISHCYANGYKTDNIKAILKKLWTLQILDERYVIAVSGLQNVGKTTLMKMIYNIPDDYLPENQGRGEKIPVLITEVEGLVGFKTFSVNILQNSNNITIETREITQKKFSEEAFEPGQDCIMLELKVPSKFFGSIEKSFILLPGIEEVKSEWQDIVHISLIGSASCIFLFNSTQYSNFQNKKTIDEEIKEGFKSTKPLFILTKSDQSSDGNAGLKDTVIKDFQLENEKDRIICSGTKTIENWTKEFERAINKYSRTTRVFRKKQIENLKNILDDLSSYLFDIDDNIRMSFVKEEVSNERKIVEQVNKVMTDTITELKKKFNKALDAELDQYMIYPKKELTDTIVDKSIWQKIKEIFVGKSLKDSQELNEKISIAWKRHNPQKLIFSSLSRVTESGLDSEFKRIVSDGNTKFISNKASNEITQQSEVSDNSKQKLINDLTILKQMNENNDLKLSDKFEKNLKYLPVICITKLVSEYCLNTDKEFVLDNRSSISANEVIEDNLSKAMSTVKNYILPIAGLVLAVDGASDGEFDIPANISKAFGTVALSASLGWTVAGLGALYLTVDTIKRVNKYEFEEKYFVDDVINHYRDAYYSNSIDRFDEMMDNLCKFIYEKMREYYNLDKTLIKNISLTKAFTDVKESTYQLKLMLPYDI
jgi:hypothetical protein